MLPGHKTQNTSPRGPKTEAGNSADSTGGGGAGRELAREPPTNRYLYSRTTPSLSSLGTKDAFSRGSSTTDTSHASPGTARDLLHTYSHTSTVSSSTIECKM
jgi:hypothetical protein